jgi:hypothetical protein
MQRAVNATMEKMCFLYGSHVSISGNGRTQECLRWQGPAAIVNDSLIVSSERYYIKTIIASVQLEKRILLVVNLQVACRQDELIGR